MIDLYLLIEVFLVSFFSCFLIIRLAPKFSFLVNDSDLQGLQKFHIDPIARIGGFGVFSGFVVALFLIDDHSNWLLKLCLSSLPVFAAGLYEDLSARVSPLARLFSAFFSIGIVFFWLNIGINSLNIEWVDYIFSNYMIASLLFSLLVIGGAVNALNIIDGFNGLLGGYSVFAFLAVAYVAFSLGDEMVLQLSLILAASILGFLILNFPFGKIFMGDGGAYFVGFMLATVGLTLVNRHEELSSWFVLLIFIYPMYELLYSIYRRKVIYKTDASQPDANHMHSLVYTKLISCDWFGHNKVICNSMVSPLMWLLSLIGITPAVIWFDNQMMLVISIFLFMFIYTIIYKRVSLIVGNVNR